MLKRLDRTIKKIIQESNLNKYIYADDLLEDVYDRIGFEKFSDILNNKALIEKLNNTEKSVLEDVKDSLWENIEKFDNDESESKNETLKFYNYIKEIILKKA